jgi:uncharacterized protein (TIRG00374 family)
VGRLVLGIGAGGLVVALLPQLIALSLETLGWKLTFRAGGTSVRFAPLFRVRVATEALAQSLPLGVAFAESLKPALLAKHSGISLETSIAGMTARKVLILVAQSLYVTGLAAFGFFGLERASRAVLGIPHLGFIAVALGLALGLGGLSSALALRDSRFARGTLRLLARVPSSRLRAWLSARERAFDAMDGAISALFRAHPSVLALPTLVFALSWLVESFETWTLLRVLGAHPSFLAVGSIEIVVSLVRNAAFMLPAGLGVQDLGYVSCFAAFGLPDAATTGAAFVLLKRSKELCFIVLGYVLLGGELGALLRGRLSDRPASSVGYLPFGTKAAKNFVA